jgi:hypothetical protein
MRATRTILTWSVAAAFGAIVGLPATATAQIARAELAQRSLYCYENYHTNPVTMAVTPQITELRPLDGLSEQWVSVRFTLYRFPQGGKLTPLQITLSWAGIARASQSTPIGWTEYYVRADGQNIPTGKIGSASPAWQLVTWEPAAPTRYYAWVEYEWWDGSTSNVTARYANWATNFSKTGIGFCSS